MSGKNIATIYFYLISTVSLILIVIGIFNGVNFAINSTQYDKYPLRYGPSGDCDYVTAYKAMPVPETLYSATPSAEEVKRQKESCEKNQEADRKEHRINDIKSAVTFTFIGVILFMIHFSQARKFSKD